MMHSSTSTSANANNNASSTSSANTSASTSTRSSTSPKGMLQTLITVITTSITTYFLLVYFDPSIIRRYETPLTKLSSIPSTSMTSVTSLNDTMIRQITHRNFMLAFIPSLNMLFHTIGKAGSSTVWHTMFTGLTDSSWNNTHCGNIHNKSRECWRSLIDYPFRLPIAQQHEILTSPDVLRVAVQRDPYERLISAFKSKYTCEDAVYHTDLKDRPNKVALLFRHANVVQHANCLNVSTFAFLLDRIRINYGRDRFVSQLSKLDNHIRPQNYFFDLIHYHLVLDIADWSNTDYIAPILDRLPRNGRNHILRNWNSGSQLLLHSSGTEQLHIPEKAAAALYRFASLSKPGTLTYNNDDNNNQKN